MFWVEPGWSASRRHIRRSLKSCAACGQPKTFSLKAVEPRSCCAQFHTRSGVTAKAAEGGVGRDVIANVQQPGPARRYSSGCGCGSLGPMRLSKCSDCNATAVTSTTLKRSLLKPSSTACRPKAATTAPGRQGSGTVAPQLDWPAPRRHHGVGGGAAEAAGTTNCRSAAGATKGSYHCLCSVDPNNICKDFKVAPVTGWAPLIGDSQISNGFLSTRQDPLYRPHGWRASNNYWSHQ